MVSSATKLPRFLLLTVAICLAENVLVATAFLIPASPGVLRAAPRGFHRLPHVHGRTKVRMCSTEDEETQRRKKLEDEIRDNTGAISYVFPRPVRCAGLVLMRLFSCLGLCQY
jgi:hypothetical protein